MKILSITINLVNVLYFNRKDLATKTVNRGQVTNLTTKRTVIFWFFGTSVSSDTYYLTKIDENIQRCHHVFKYHIIQLTVSMSKVWKQLLNKLLV